MTIELDRNDITNLIKGTHPSYELMENETIKRLGTYCGGFNDRWDWRGIFPEDITNESLLDVYYLLKRG